MSRTVYRFWSIFWSLETCIIVCKMEFGFWASFHGVGLLVNSRSKVIKWENDKKRKGEHSKANQCYINLGELKGILFSGQPMLIPLLLLIFLAPMIHRGENPISRVLGCDYVVKELKFIQFGRQHCEVLPSIRRVRFRWYKIITCASQIFGWGGTCRIYIWKIS